jgi:hypothetical protein
MSEGERPIRRFEVEIVDEVTPPPKAPPLAGDTPRRRPRATRSRGRR